MAFNNGVQFFYVSHTKAARLNPELHVSTDSSFLMSLSLRECGARSLRAYVYRTVAAGTSVALLEPAMARAFPTSKAVNERSRAYSY